MPAKRYIVSLTPEEHQTLEELTKKGKAAAAKINHARILLKADVNHPKKQIGNLQLLMLGLN
jgi:hypothetical protein